MRSILNRVAAAAVVFSAVVAQASVVVDMVTVGNVGNAADTRYTPNFGAVGYSYQIGKFEITAAQYTDFLNAVADTDTFFLYQTNLGATPMSSDTQGCKIMRTGASGSYVYSVAPDYANRPVNFVSWADAARFANWMHNGQPNGPQGLGTTENGSYFLNNVLVPAGTVARAPGATWAIPNEDEWYKAAYYDTAMPGGPGYWEYAMRTNTKPGRLLLDLTGTNANYGAAINGNLPIDSPYYTTTGGEFENSLSPYGTFDMNGNVREWVETVSGANRFFRGGEWTSGGGGGVNQMQAQSRNSTGAGGTSSNTQGFRLVLIPEPSTLALLAIGGLGIFRRKR